MNSLKDLGPFENIKKFKTFFWVKLFLTHIYIYIIYIYRILNLYQISQKIFFKQNRNYIKSQKKY